MYSFLHDKHIQRVLDSSRIIDRYNVSTYYRSPTAIPEFLPLTNFAPHAATFRCALKPPNTIKSDVQQHCNKLLYCRHVVTNDASYFTFYNKKQFITEALNDELMIGLELTVTFKVRYICIKE